MMTSRFWTKCVGVALIPFVFGACAMFRGGGKAASTESASAEQPPAAASRQEQTKEVAKLVQDYIGETAGAGPGDARLIHMKPYWYKEYSVYPQGPNDYKLTLHETESRTAPYLADVRLERQRIATRFHRNKDEAQKDGEFYRETGTDTVTFEYRNGHWRRVSSLFVVDRTEQLVNGQWTPVEGKVSRVAGSDSSGNWFRRTWQSITGD